MDPSSAAHLLALAETLYNDALDCDRKGLDEMCTANLELTMQILIGVVEGMFGPSGLKQE